MARLSRSGKLRRLLGLGAVDAGESLWPPLNRATGAARRGGAPIYLCTAAAQS